MIGVAVHPSERAAARELFELFKTPWEFHEPDRDYDVLISSSSSPGSARATLSLLFGADPGAFDAARGLTPQLQPAGTTLTHAARRFPIYGHVATFPAPSQPKSPHLKGAAPSAPLKQTAAATHALLRTESTQAPALFAFRHDRQTTVRVGYNLFAEVQFLLTTGQPAHHAGTATLENHLALLRDLITRAGLPLVEIPPVPAGYPFMVCLTHDIDHPLLRNHCCDHTMAGFLSRAALVSPLNFCRGRIPFAAVLRNWAAVLRLPFVYLGWARDPWSSFDRYTEIEAGLGSTYFFIPQRDYPGLSRPRNSSAEVGARLRAMGHGVAERTDSEIARERAPTSSAEHVFRHPQRDDGPAPAKRACRYSLSELSSQLQRILATGNEVGLHGIDAWRDAQAGRAEQQRLVEATKGLSFLRPDRAPSSDVGPPGGRAARPASGPTSSAQPSIDRCAQSDGAHKSELATESGIRMHWLYFDEQSPARLEEAGFSYDSTFGYNETIGYRAGTAQAFRPLGNEQLIELPLLVMDTALFYPSYLNLSEPAAGRLVGKVLDDVTETGGALTINWHDRSLFAERLWGDFYQKLLGEMQRRRVWFPTAAQAVAWFRKRRSASLTAVQTNDGKVEIQCQAGEPDSLPGLTLRLHRPCPRTATEPLATGPQAGYEDLPFAGVTL
jgi:hypothetical protein